MCRFMRLPMVRILARAVEQMKKDHS